MHSLLRIVCVSAAFVSACSHAPAAEKTMPINFIGEWCYSSQENQTTSYNLQSWTEDGRCTKILSIEQYGFYGERSALRAGEYAAQNGYCTVWHRVIVYDDCMSGWTAALFVPLGEASDSRQFVEIISELRAKYDLIEEPGTSEPDHLEAIVPLTVAYASG